MNGGDLIGEVLVRQGVRFLFTLCGGHISPILVGDKKLGIRVVDTRHEVDAVFAADAVFRLTGVPGVAAVTAGPGVTNTITAVKNAQLAQSALVVLGGAAATPGTPVRRKTASAANTASTSWRTSTTRMPRSLAPTRMGEICPPQRVKRNRTPCATSTSAIRSPPFITNPPY